ncbi:hypothetical protein LTR62_005240 [Meristemomyces frigidus]|uniref:Store-operated calcium entry-associated regulatory factor n=1 Tax=Meristemomyces frigidus TaxID=1508187 RepID=A0AAN7TD56_9PEZI|nr:hypothetical protein LTR62_005240 [Meristemomyces frigidus]
MHIPHLLLALSVATTTTVSAKASTRSNTNSISLSKVKALTLRDGDLTTARRVEPIPQLTCTGGNAKGLYTVDVMRCENAGYEYDAEDVQWTCKASLPPEFKLGGTEVICEGYDSPDDPLVLKGSCGVEYRLVLTPKGEERYGLKESYASVKFEKGSGMQAVSDKFFTLFFWLVFAGIAYVILSRIIFPGRNAGLPGNARRVGWPGGGGGGGGNDDDNDDRGAPPPYTPRAPKSSADYTSNRRAGQSNDGTWRPGFWTGAATAAAAGYAANSFANRSNNTNTRPNPNRVHGYDAPAAAGPSNWFGGGGRSANNGRSSSSWASSPPASSGSSSGRYESTGFGGTSRR